MKKLFIAAIIFVLTSNVVSAQKKVKLELKPEIGKDYKSSFSMESKSVINMGMPMTNLIQMDFEYNLNCTKIEDEQIYLDAEFDRITMSLDVLGKSINYDSGNLDTADQYSQELDAKFRTLLNKKFEYIYTKNGEVVELPDFSSLSEVPGMNSAEVSNMPIILPKKTIKKGSKWKETKEATSTVNYKVTRTYTVTDISDGKVFIDILGEINIGDVGSNTEFVVKKSDGKSYGKGIIDIKSGYIILQDVTQILNLDIEAQGMDMTVKATNKVKTTTDVE